MVQKIVSIVSAVKFAKIVWKGHVSLSRVNDIRGKVMSRSTVYRHLVKAEKMGLVSRDKSDIPHVWQVTDQGYDFLGAWNELPFREPNFRKNFGQRL